MTEFDTADAPDDISADLAAALAEHETAQLLLGDKSTGKADGAASDAAASAATDTKASPPAKAGERVRGPDGKFIKADDAAAASADDGTAAAATSADKVAEPVMFFNDTAATDKA